MTYLHSLATYKGGFQLVGVDVLGADSLTLYFVGPAPTSETVHHARSSLRHGHQLDDMAVVVLVIEAAAAIPSVELSVLKAPGPASEGEPSVFDPLQDRVEFGVAYVKRIMLACDSPIRVSEVQRQCVVDAHRRKVTA